MDSRGDVKVPVLERDDRAPRVRRTLDGVGMAGEILECMVAERPNRTASGVVSGRWWAW